MFSPDALRQRSAEATKVTRDLTEQGVEFVQIEIPDLNGTVRGKLAGVEKGLSPAGTAVSTLTVSFRSHDEVSLTPFSNYENAFPKMLAVPDLSTAVRWPFRPDMGAVLCDFFMEDGTPCPMDARQILKRVVERYRELDLEPRAAVEYEFYVYEADDALLRENRYRELKTFGRGWDCYSVARFPTFENLGKEFITRMKGVNVDVEAFHTELGHGMLEFALAHQPAVKAADDAVRAKLYFKQLCAERDLVATFMPVIHVGTGDSSSGAHHHISLWRDGKNLSWDPDRKTLDPLTRKLAAGMMETMPDFPSRVSSLGQQLPPLEPAALESGERFVGARQPHRRHSRHPRLHPLETYPARAPRSRRRCQSVPVPRRDAPRRPVRHRERSRARGLRRGGPVEVRIPDAPENPSQHDRRVRTLRAHPPHARGRIRRASFEHQTGRVDGLHEMGGAERGLSPDGASYRLGIPAIFRLGLALEPRKGNRAGKRVVYFRFNSTTPQVPSVMLAVNGTTPSTRALLPFVVSSKQDEISAAIAAQLAVDLDRAEHVRAQKRDPESLEAWGLYQRALPLFYRFRREDFAKARALLERAVSLDPQFSTALARLVELSVWEVVFGWTEADEERLEGVIAAARRAVALDPRDPQTHLSLSFALMASNKEEALLAARRALDLNPSMPWALSGYAYLRLMTGHPPEESIALVERALRLSPQDPAEWIFYDVLAGAYLNAGRYEEGLLAGRRLTMMVPDYYFGYLWCAMNSVGHGDLGAGRDFMEQARRALPHLTLDLVRHCFGAMADSVEGRIIGTLTEAGLE
jgi:tetratricopeptide (TPR) repeat protein